jgi:N6-adenosine-specific RNA methylase IME4
MASTKISKILSTDAALAALEVVERKIDSAGTYKEIRKLIAEAAIVKAMMGHIIEVRKRAEWVMILASARAGEEIDKVPKAVVSGRIEFSNRAKFKKGEGRAAIGVPGWTRSRLLKLAKSKSQLRRLAERIWKLGKEATVSAILRDIKNEIIATKRAEHDAKVSKGGNISDLNGIIESGKKFAVIYADPPWAFKVWGERAKGHKGGLAENHYSTMTLHEIAALPVAALAAKDCTLLLWCVMPELPGAIDIIKAWGFEYKTAGFVWAKLNRGGKGWFYGMGYWTRSNVELCLLATRGSPHRVDTDVEQLVVEPIRAHSQKPEEVQIRIERLLLGPYIELFARKERHGWITWGNELKRTAQAAE